MFSIAKKNPAARFSFAVLTPGLCANVLFVVFARGTFAQELLSPHKRAGTPLSELLDEAEKNNPQMEAARQGWQAAKQVPFNGLFHTHPN
jgi:hypothetical protein